MAKIIDRDPIYLEKFGEGLRLVSETITLRLSPDESLLIRDDYPVTLKQTLKDYIEKEEQVD